MCGRHQTTTTTRGIACQGSSFSLLRLSRGGIAAGGGLKGWVVDKNCCRGVTASSAPASVDVNESPSPHIAINTYSTNRQEAAIGKSPNQHFKTTPLQRHQSACIVVCLSALMDQTLQCVFQTASFPLTKVE